MAIDFENKRPRIGDTIKYVNPKSSRGGSRYIVIGYPMDKQRDGSWEEKICYKSIDTGMEFTRSFDLLDKFELVEQ